MIDNVLVVDDEQLIRDLLKDTIKSHGIDVKTASSAEEAMEMVVKEDFQVIFSDMRMKGKSGLDVLEFVRKKKLNPVFIIMTAYGSIETAVDAMKLGAFDFIIKPFTPDQTDVILEKAKNWLELNARCDFLQKEVKKAPKNGSTKVLGDSEEMQNTLRLINRVAPTDATVLITGESGTGKELIASEVHRLSDSGSNKPYIKMNCAAVPETLLESELFGHEKGAFTGATERRVGRFELADGGTLLLDEIGEITLGMQAKLLRVLQESEFERVGGNKTQKVNVRVIASTNKNLRKEVEDGNFREDLYYRLNVFPIHLPPLRDRGFDKKIIASSFLEKQAKKLGRDLQFSPDAVDMIMEYSWPGNIREMQNVIERVAILEDGPEIPASALPLNDRRIIDNVMEDIFNVRDLERSAVMRSLRKTKGNRSRAADLLGFSVRTLRNKIHEYRAEGKLDPDPWFDKDDD